VFSIRHGKQLLGELIVQDGEPRWAKDNEGEGEAAFRRLALLQKMDVSCQPLTAPLSKVNLSGSLEHLLIDAARHADESRRTPVVPPLESVPAASPERPPPPSARALALGGARPPPLPPRPSRSQRLPVIPRPQDMSALDSAEPSSIALPKPPSVSASSQENPVNPSRFSPSVQQLLSLDPSLKAVARADRHGSVLECAGDGDAETACAVATMAARQVVEAAAELGFGRPTAWQLSLGNDTWYVAHSRDELVVGQGAISKNPGATLKKLAKSCGV
jgi:hypothetical protein